ncbi:HD domain-containing protein [Butyrivibrio sp. NC3005]|uniref:HD domain-containing protein n=1 Tax=Butyrivibrio sp. NC3005 TaxID=1280685 RepID=UPI00040055E3|nr:HD domain-containing protein [Butyrivibrio sp. NC3005]
MKINRERVTKVFNDYVAEYNAEDVKVKLKIDHTYRVADLCEKIAISLNLEKGDVDLAWLLGMFHDIGRFEQLRIYDTFEDAASVNHAALSADILYKDGLVKKFIDDTTQDRLIEKAVRLHNVYELPESLTDRERMFCQILRDADKVDILKVNCDIPMEEIYNMPKESFYTEPVTPKVLEDALAKRNVNRAHMYTSIDHLVGHISLVYGLCYKESIRETKKQGYLDKMLSFKSNNPEALEALDKIRQKIDEFMDNALASSSDRK